LANYRSTLERIKVNTKKSPLATYAPNQFADLSVDEFRFMYLMNKTSTPTQTIAISCLANGVTAEAAGYRPGAVPTSWDWRQEGAVTNVKNQGDCGSCWTFSATANIEGQYFLTNAGPLTSFSEQQIVDCDTTCEGCNGGWMIDAFMWLADNGGQETLAAYPYEGVDQKCKFEPSKAVAFLQGYFNVSSNETIMAQVVYQTGPLSVAADASSWQFYFGGIFKPLFCGHTVASLDHGITIVGYGNATDIFGTTEDYWIIKNSWGADWGEAGYIKLFRGDGECGINLAVSSAVMA